MSRETTDKNQQYFYEEDEIDLYELWLVLKRRKNYVLITMLIFLILGSVFILVSPNIYRAFAIVTLPSVGGSGRVIVDFPTTSQIVKTIDERLKKKELKNLPGNLRDHLLKAKVEDVLAEPVDRKKGGKVFLLKVEGSNKENLSNALFSVIDYLNENQYVKKKINEQKELIKTQIYTIERKIPELEQEAKLLKGKLLKSQKIKIVGFNPSDIDRTIIQLKSKLENLRYLLSSGIHGYEVIYSSVSEKPVKPKKGLILGVSFISGLFLGIFVAFFVEWLENARRRFSGAQQQ